jgi:hypothetical protein
MMEDNKPQETKQLTLLESFKLYVWTMWKGGCFSDATTAQLLGFMDRLGPKETIDFCMGELKELVEKEKDVYNGAFRESMVNGSVVEGSGEASGTPIGGSSESTN